MSRTLSTTMAALLFLVGCGTKQDQGRDIVPPDRVGPFSAADAAKDQDAPQQAEAASVTAQIQEAAKRGDLDSAIQLAEQALEANPKDAELLSMLAVLCQSHGFKLVNSQRQTANAAFIKSADYMRRLRAAVGTLNPSQRRVMQTALYNEACAHALEGNRGKALASLREAFESGFSDFDLAETDADLQSLREDPGFKELLEELRVKRLEQARQEAQEMLAAHQPFEFSFALPDTKGVTVSLADFKGKVVIVDIWGTWCPPCRKEIPHFVALHNKYQEAGLEIVGINYERGPNSEWNEQIESFKADYDIPYPCVIGDDATREMIPEFRGYPTTLFIDRTGVVRLKVVGYHPMEQLEAIVSQLLSESKTKV